MKLGIHLSIEKNIAYLPELARKLEINCFQFFSKSPRKWSTRFIDNDIAKAFKENLVKYNFLASEVFIHCSYLINPANPSQKTYNELESEFENACLLGVENLVLHPGSCKSSDSLKTVAKTLNNVISKYPTLNILIENTTRIGANLQDLFIIKNEISHNVYYCIDTCHLFVSGYNLDMDNITRILDVNDVKLWHLNDSKAAFDSKLDRHANLGKGFVGIDKIKAFLRSINKEVCIILETPGTNQTRSKEVSSIRTDI